MKRTLKFLALAAALAASTSATFAATLTFEGQFNTIYNSPISRSGFSIGNVVGDEQHFHEIDSTQFSLISNGTGVLLNDRDSRIFFELIGGGVFSGITIDVASSGSSNDGSGIGIDIEGFLAGNSVGVINVPFTISQGFQTVNLASLGNVDRIVFNGIQGGFELDNAVLGDGTTQVPLPPTVALVLAGVAALGARRKLGR